MAEVLMGNSGGSGEPDAYGYANGGGKSLSPKRELQAEPGGDQTYCCNCEDAHAESVDDALRLPKAYAYPCDPDGASLGGCILPGVRAERCR